MTQCELIGLTYSPWTEKARWALQHHKVPFRYSEHLMIFGMPVLRWKMRKPFGDVTVPALVDRSKEKPVRLGDSWDIAVYADQIGNGAPLFPKGRVDEIEAMNRFSERALSAARALIVDRTRSDRATQLEILPKFIPTPLKKPMRFLAAVGLDYIAREFNTRTKSLEEHRLDLREVLAELRRLVKKSKGGPLLGEFSYADIVMAASLHFVSPPENAFLKIGPSTRACWTDQELARDFSDLVAWRDELYRKFRKR